MLASAAPGAKSASGTTHTPQVAVSSKALVPAIRSSPDSLNFGRCPVGERKDVVLTLKNTHAQLPVNFSIPQTPNYRCEPAKGTLLPLQNAQIIVSFIPKQLGTFNQTIKICYCNEMCCWVFGRVCHGKGANVCANRVGDLGHRESRDAREAALVEQPRPQAPIAVSARILR